MQCYSVTNSELLYSAKSCVKRPWPFHPICHLNHTKPIPFPTPSFLSPRHQLLTHHAHPSPSSPSTPPCPPLFSLLKLAICIHLILPNSLHPQRLLLPQPHHICISPPPTMPIHRPRHAHPFSKSCPFLPPAPQYQSSLSPPATLFLPFIPPCPSYSISWFCRVVPSQQKRLLGCSSSSPRLTL